MNGCLYAKLTGRSDNGTADISAEAYHNVRFKFFDYFFDLSRGTYHKKKSFNVFSYIFSGKLSLEAGNFNGFKGETRRRYKL